MAKSPGRIALYELVNKARFKSAQQKALAATGAKQPSEEQPTAVAPVQVQPQPQVEVKPEQLAEVQPEPQTELKPVALWSARPKPVRVYADRIELCFSWQVVGIAALTFVVLLLIFFKLGRISSTGQTEAVVKKPVPVSVSVQQIMPKTRPAETVVKPTPQPQAAPPKVVEPMGDNVLVIASHKADTDLKPVKQYFAKFGIATEIIKDKRSSRYLLVTENRFNDTEKPGTDGYVMKRKIMSIGANYKPSIESGFASFGPKPFQDVYGMKLD
ncbi:MAG: hypothetical protein WC770_04155 [Phycisphaerae bacterium]|jgi:hypothetical protein